jgi:hypothetical protein
MFLKENSMQNKLFVHTTVSHHTIKNSFWNRDLLQIHRQGEFHQIKCSRELNYWDKTLNQNPYLFGMRLWSQINLEDWRHPSKSKPQGDPIHNTLSLLKRLNQARVLRWLSIMHGWQNHIQTLQCKQLLILVNKLYHSEILFVIGWVRKSLMRKA